MAYRKRETYSRKLKAMREAKIRQIEEWPAPEYPLALPELRRQVIVRDMDFGTVEHRIDLYRTNRIDTYNMLVDGRPYQNNVGWSTVLEIIRKQFLRVRSL